MMFLSSILLLAFVSAAIGSSGLNPIDNYCWRYDHQSTVKNGTLYIDGGIEVFVGENNNGSATGELITGYTTSLITVDLSSSWNWRENIPITALNKTANPDTGTEPPLVVDAALYSGPSDGNSIYLYGGSVSYVNTTFPGYQKPTSSQYALWSYDTTSETWGQYDVSLDTPYRPAGGAYAEAPDQGLAFWLNGYINNGTSNSLENWDGLYQFLDGLVVIDTETQTATNVSTSSLTNFPRVKGALTYLPNVGSKGILVSLGGVTKPASDTTDSNPGSYVPFDEIDFLDIASLDDDSSKTSGSGSGTWHTQPTTGDVPDGRTEFCVVTASAKDNSSHNIYLYGGRSTDKLYDDIYVLSIPSFTWTKIYEGASPRYAHTCHLVANRQMLTVGGSSDVDQCDWEMKGVGVYDISTLNWGDKYDAQAEEYEVPAKVYRVIKGDANGNAEMQAPSNGFSSPEIANLFNSNSSINSSPSSSSSPDNNNKKGGISGGAIAGAVIGSVAGAAIIAALIVFFIWRRKRQAAQAQGKLPLNGEGGEGKGAGGSASDNDEIVTGPVWRNRYGRRVELPNSQVSGQQPQQQPQPQVQPQQWEQQEQPLQTVYHEVPADPVHEMEATEVRPELPSHSIVEKD